MNKRLVLATISRWIDIRMNKGYEIVTIGFKGMKKIEIEFKEGEKKDGKVFTKE